MEALVRLGFAPRVVLVPKHAERVVATDKVPARSGRFRDGLVRISRSEQRLKSASLMLETELLKSSGVLHTPSDTCLYKQRP